MAMIFSLVTFLEDWITSQNGKNSGGVRRLVISEDTNKDSESENAAKITLIEEKVLASGTPVTRESFLKWNAAFLAEKQANMPAVVVKESKLTGKQLFEQNKALAASDAGYGDDEAVVEVHSNGGGNDKHLFYLFL